MSSWFYLTLWRGTPPEFTSSAKVSIETNEHAKALIQKKNESTAQIRTLDGVIAKINESEKAGAEVITKTEVIWLVGGA